MRAAPPTKTWSASSSRPVEERTAGGGDDVVGDRVTASPASASAVAEMPRPDEVRGEVGGRPAAARSSPISATSSRVCFSTAPLDSTTTTAPRGRQADQLDRAHGGPVVHGRDDHRGVVGQVGQQAAGVGQHLLELAVGLGEEGPDLLALAGSSGPGASRESTKNR